MTTEHARTEGDEEREKHKEGKNNIEAVRDGYAPATATTTQTRPCEKSFHTA